MTAKYAAAHPGKMGDALYTLPTMRYVYGITGEKFDFYTSDYCAPLKRLFEYQPYIENFYVLDNYKVERMDMGCQPWYMPVPDQYDRIFQMGFQEVPDRMLHQYMASKQGVTTALGIGYECPPLDNGIDGEYVVLGTRHPSSYDDMFKELATTLYSMGITPVYIGGSGECLTTEGIDKTGLDMLETCSILSNAKAFVGLMSSQLVLANGFPIKRIAPHDGRSWDMRHAVNYHLNYYPINPSVGDIIRMIQG